MPFFEKWTIKTYYSLSEYNFGRLFQNADLDLVRMILRSPYAFKMIYLRYTYLIVIVTTVSCPRCRLVQGAPEL